MSFRDKYTGVPIEILDTPPLDPPEDKNYYPKPKVEVRLKQLFDDVFELELLKLGPAGMPLPLFWEGARFQHLLANAQLDPHSLHKSHERFYGVVYLVDRFFHVWLRENENSAPGALECFTVATTDIDGIVKVGGFTTGKPPD